MFGVRRLMFPLSELISDFSPNEKKLARYSEKRPIFVRWSRTSTPKGARLAAVFFLAGACLVPQAPVLAAIFILVGLFCAFEAWSAWCAIRACGFKLPF